MSAIDTILSQLSKQFSSTTLKDTYQKLSHAYREKGHIPQLKTDEEIWAYTLARLPATYEVDHEVLQNINNIESVLDLGCGPGTGSWAAINLFDNLKKLTLVDSSPAMLKMAQLIGDHYQSYEFEYQQKRLDAAEFTPHDLVIFSYSLSELDPKKYEQILSSAWVACNKYLVVIEPGTPIHFKNLLLARDHAVKLGGEIIAPCPHSLQCPMQDTADWCHFSKRLPRNSEHKFIKSATLSYEDEKYSYFIAAKHPEQRSFTQRIIKNPLKRSGHILFDLCTMQGLQRTTISKKHPEYKKYSKLDWGDGL